MLFEAAQVLRFKYECATASHFYVASVTLRACNPKLSSSLRINWAVALPQRSVSRGHRKQGHMTSSAQFNCEVLALVFGQKI